MTTRSRNIFIGVVIIASIGIGLWYLSRSPVGIEKTEGPDVTLSTMTVTALELPAVENKAFAAGEKLTYKVIFKGITVGHTLIEVRNGAPVNERPTLQYVSTTESTKFFDPFFKVRDENISTVDAASLFSVAFDQNLHEGHYKAVRNYIFNYRQRRFSVSKKNKAGPEIKEGPLNAPFYDVLSALFAVRVRPLTPSQELRISIFRDNTGKPLPIKINAALKELKTPLGKISCLRVEPVLQGDSLFKEKDNRLVVWMTNDEKKIPVLIEATISAGLIRVKLEKWEK